jgi:hypothetical protein
MKYSLKGFVQVQNPYGAKVKVMYRIKDLSKWESFRLLVNGELQLQTNEDTKVNLITDSASYTLDQSFDVYSAQVSYGLNSFEISLISRVPKDLQFFKSKARAEIKKIVFEGSGHGGAAECLEVPNGWYAPDLSSEPL